MEEEWGENKGKRKIEQAGDFLSSAIMAWAGPRTCFLPGTVSALTFGYGMDFGAHRQIGSWGADDLCIVLKSHTLMVGTPNF